MRANIRQILLYILGSVVFLSLPVLFSPDLVSTRSLLRVAPFQRDFLSYVLLLGFFYLHFFFLIPRLYFNKKILLYSLAVLASFLVIVFLPDLLIPHGFPFEMKMPALPDGMKTDPYMPRMPMPKPFLWGVSQHLFQFLLVLIASLMIRINNRWKRAERGRLNAELSYLKAQINPHFLFNTLNSIYSLAIQKSEHTPTAVVKLSEMMRYVITESENDFVSLEKEINYVVDYIELQKIRLGDTVELIYSVNGELSGKKIAPLVLIPFVENAFKYGVNAEENSDIRISINVGKGNIELVAFNNKVNVKASESSSGLGVDNTRNRLRMLYPGKHWLTIKETVEYYSVSLIINIE